ncbi:MAG: light-independent protochlorophyllide reductase subunit B [Methanosaeta sp. PtaU1.Bin055]|nr:MAG: light-independent protochlorophyllide reductase subunit B [Methanosaeta sp. PtaU1.Bin055]
MNPEELDLISRDEAPILDTMRRIYSAVPVHHLAAIHGKIVGALAVADAIVGALPLIHGPVGCAFQRKLNPFNLSSTFYDTPCTNLNNVDVVYGAEEKLCKGVVEAYERYSPRLIIVITTCTTDLIGDDIEAAVEKAMEMVGCPVVYSTGDFVGRSRPVGIQDALYAVADQMICRNEVEKSEGSVNLINSPTQRNALKFQEMARLLTQMEIKINKICFDHTTTEDMMDLARADLNITGYRMPWAELMKEKMNVDYCKITGWDRYNKKKDPELISPYGIAGSCRFLEEIARIMGREGEAEPVIKKNRTAAEARLEAASKELKGVKVAVPVGFSLNLLKDIGVDVAALIYRTQTLSHGLTERAVREIERANLSLAELYGFHPELLVNPTPDEELKTFRKRQVDLVMAPAKIAHFYNREGIRTVDVGDFTQKKLNVGFFPSIELCRVFREALGKAKVRSPLLDLMEFDGGISNLTPHWAKTALSFHHLRSKNFRDGYYYHFQGLAGVELNEHNI